MITAITYQDGIEEEKLNPVEVGSPLSPANIIGSLADHISGGLKKEKAEAFFKDLEAAKFFTESLLAESTRQAYESDWRGFC